MLVILGKTCSGKDTIIDALVANHGFKKIIKYTTRPMRKGEKQGISYHFISEDNFKQKIETGFFIEWRCYNTAHGIWYYGISSKDFTDYNYKNIIFLTPDEYKSIEKSKKFENLVSIYLYANNKTISDRLVLRGENEKEAKRRLLSDNQNFKNVESFVDKIVYNNSGEKLSDVVDKILEIYNKQVQSKN